MILYNGWEVSQLKENAWKATKGNESFNACSAKMIKAMINDHEGLPIHSEKLIKNQYFINEAIKKPSVEKQLQVYRRVRKKRKDLY